MSLLVFHPDSLPQFYEHTGTACYTFHAFSSLLLLILSPPVRRKQQEAQCKYDVTLRRGRELLLPWKSNKYYLLACVCTRVRACIGYTGAWACARVYVHAALLIQHARRMYHIVTSFVAPRSPSCFSTLSHKRCNFQKNVVEQKMRVLIFSTSCI